MMNFGKSKIGRRIVVLVVVSVILSLITLTGLFLTFQLNDTLRTRTDGIKATGYVFASAIADDVATGNANGALKVLRSITRVPDVSYAVAVDSKGEQIAALGKSAMLVEDLVDDHIGMFELLTRGALPVTIEIVKGAEPVGRLIIVADVSGLRAQLLKTVIATLLAALVAGILGIVAAMRLQRRITAPILSLIGAMSHVRQARDYSTKVIHDADDETGTLVESFNAMITEIGYRDSALKRLAFFDPLTGLANRQSFHGQLETVLASCVDDQIKAALFLLDLDEFKSINDSYGHSAGDALLVNVAAALKHNASEHVHLARLGGDEFAIVVTGIDSEAEAQAVFAPIIQAISQPVEIMARHVQIGVTAGVTMIPRDGTTPSDLLRRADLALYSAKREGKGRMHIYRPKLDEDVQERTALAIDLRHAIRENQLEVHYQPQVNIHSGGVIGYESLLRWKHPTRGYVPPDQFIPIAESNGLICDLGQWILRQSCRQARAWLDSGFAVRQISVNISVAQIRQFNFPGQVEAILAETRLPPYILCLELTESLFAGYSAKRVKQVLEGLKGVGVSLAIDDFGTGYSSLSYLQGLPFDKLKIDRAFVSGIEEDADKRRLLTGVIDLGHALDLTIVAEGAETPGEIALLRQMQADQVQGYVFSKPLPAAQIVAATEEINCNFHERFTAPAELRKAG